MSTDGHGGNLNRLARQSGRAPEDILDFSANINPLGPPEWLRPVVSGHVSCLSHYPDPDCSALTAAISERYSAAPDGILAGNGSTELLYLLAQVAGTRRAVIPVPAYADYARAARLAGMEIVTVPPADEDDFRFDPARLSPLLCGSATVFLGRPNNPTGIACDAEAVRTLAASHPQCFFLVDEAFGDFVEGFDSLTQRRPANVAVLLSLTKIFAIPGLRLGCAVADAAVSRRARERQPPWTVNTLAQAVGVAALRDRDYIERSRAMVRDERERLLDGLRSVRGLTVYAGAANFLLARLGPSLPDAPALAGRLLGEDGIAIRVCDNFQGLDGRCFRVAVRTTAENERLLMALRRVLEGRRTLAKARRTPAIMFQGTSSNAGKSVMTAALCRILFQDGVRVAPFKAQNMSLNSFVTRDGGEMGRAQVLQAQACRIAPDVRMNPVLLKPNSDTGSQVIVMGKPVGNMTVGEYIRYKPEAFRTVCRAYDELAADFDALVIEGAGSPGEVNLKQHDIVNMTMARYAGAPVLLVGDIDRGGVFASFVGTMEVLTEWERALVAGFVVNRFRGQESLLRDALDYTRRHTGRPVLGVVPYLAGMNLPEEDSVTFKSGALDRTPPGDAEVVVAVIDLPHISNFTDFDCFRMEPDVHLRVIRSGDEIGAPDALIIPGSKNTLGDLAYLRRSGLAERIVQLAAAGKVEIVGICGGLQMIGRDIRDPESVESGAGHAAGLGLLEVETVMESEKTLLRSSARHAPSGLTVEGYEIHHGRTDTASAAPLLVRPDGEVVGMAAADGRVWGTYLHGVFDADAFRRWFIDRLRVRRGLAALGGVTAAYNIEPALDRLADVVRTSLRMDDIYRIMGLRCI
jgi:cobyric acid synthase CobQ/L-threonine-O-3-phosphate decarboxylase